MIDNSLRPRKLADLTPENLKRILDDMGHETAGWYASADLYRWYVGMCEEDDLEPVSRRKFGGVLRDLGYRTSTRRVDGKAARCWFLTNRAFRGGALPSHMATE